MNEVLRTSRQMTLPGIANVISSLGSVDGVTPYDLQDGLTTGRSGRGVAPANLSATQAGGEVSRTSDISGQNFSESLSSAALTQSLVSRLHQKSALLGSTLYTLTWKERITPSGRSIPALRASVRRISDNGCTGWPTPNASNTKGAYADVEKYLARKDAGRQNNLQDVVRIAGWPTPTTADARRGRGTLRPHDTGIPLPQMATFASWVTPSARDWKDTPRMSIKQPDGSLRLDHLPRQAVLAGWNTPAASDGDGGKRPHPNTTMSGRHPSGRKVNMGIASQCHIGLQGISPARLTASGVLLTGSSAGMDGSGQLNPAHSRWIMGYLHEWDDCAVTAMQSFHSRRKHSSKQ